MSALIEHPQPTEVMEFVNGLLGLAVTESNESGSPANSVAEYVNANGDAVGYVTVDLAGGCRLGAALTQIPAGRVDEAISEGAIPDSLAENLDEVFNICVNLIHSANEERVVLGRSYHGEAANDVISTVAAVDDAEKAQYVIDVARYGACTLTIARC